MLQNKTIKILFSKKDRGFLCDTGSSCFEWIVEHEQTTYDDDGESKTSDWWEAYLSFSNSYRTVDIFNCMHESDLADKLAMAKVVHKSMGDFIDALEGAVKNQ